jgi:hypothetical protein
MSREVCTRVSSMMQAFRPLEQRIFAEKTIPQQSRMSLVTVLLHTKTFYNAGTWSWLTDRGNDTLKNAITKVLKSVSHMHSDGTHQWREDQIYDDMMLQR